MESFMFLTTQQEDSRQKFQERMSDGTCKLDPPANEQRPCTIATVAQEGSIFADAFGWQRCQWGSLAFRRISELMLFTMG